MWEGDLPEAEEENLIPQADVVGITGTAFTNHTLDYLLELCNLKPMWSCWEIQLLYHRFYLTMVWMSYQAQRQ